MEKRIAPIPEGYHSVTPNIILRDAKNALEFYKNAFDAKMTFYQESPEGKVMHATIKIGDSILMAADECPPHKNHAEECVRSPADLGGTSVNIYLYVEDVDSVFKKAIEAGAKEMRPVSDMFWGDRLGMLKDPYGHFWTIATQKELVSEEELKKRLMNSYSNTSTPIHNFLNKEIT